MNLLAQAEADNAFLIEDKATGFGTDITFTPATGSPVTCVGMVSSVSTEIDPLTGAVVAAGKTVITVRTSRVSGITDWANCIIDTTVQGVAVKFKVPKNGTGVLPDKTLGRTTIYLKKEDSSG